MKIITALFFICVVSITIPQFAMEPGSEWDSFIFIPSQWTITTFLELQCRNEGTFERAKEAFITAYKDRFRKLFGDDTGFLRCTAQQLIRLGCEQELTRNPARALKG
jgi:hypothetical protein